MFVGVISGIIASAIFAIFAYFFREKINNIWNYIVDTFENSSYKIIKVRKHVAIYDNGFGIFTTCYKIRVLVPEKFKEFKKFLDLSDNCKDHPYNFHENFDINKNLDKKKRFEELQFYWNSNKKDAFEKVLVDKENSNSHKLEYKFILKPDKLKKREEIDLIITITVPCAFPIVDGYLSNEKLKDNSKTYITSRFAIIDNYDSIEYTLAIDSNINLKSVRAFYIKDRKYDDEFKRKEITKSISDIIDNFYYRKKLYFIKPKKNNAIEYQIEISKMN